ncbi:MAG: diguanylate cyclase [Actinomycetota bacterium]|nr:diguanylate cyclase [Actinomycetota bacterium]
MTPATSLSASFEERRTSLDLDALPVPAVTLGAGGRVLAVNGAGLELLPADPRGRELDVVLPCGATPLAEGRWRTELTGRDGVPFLVDVHLGPSLAGVRVALMLRVAESALLAESSRHLDAAFELAPIGMAFFNPAGEYVRVNAALCRLLGRTAEDLLGRRDQDVTHPAHRASDVAAAWRILAGEIDCWQTEKRFLLPGGEVVWAIANMTFLRDEEGRALHWLGQFQDITARKELEGRLQRLADEDPLTGLPNRRRFERELESTLALSARNGPPGALLLLDLDGFKAINDLHGHAVGDATLVAIARELRARLRRTDTLVRVGGDEFALLLPHTGEQAARRVALDVEATVRATTLGAGKPTVALSVSVGVAAFGDAEHPSPAELLARADADMYAAKRRTAAGPRSASRSS